MSLELLRKKIDSLDDKIVSLIEERAKLAKKIGAEKKKLRLPVFEASREKSIVERVSKKAKVIGKESISRVYSEIMAACRGIQQEKREAEPRVTGTPRVSFLGPLGTFSHIAALKHFGNSAGLIPKESVDEVFKSVERGESAYGVVPIENSTEGSIGATLDLLRSSPLNIAAELKLKVEHNLLALPGVKLSDISAVYAHPQALAQCKKFLSSLKAQKRQSASNASACGSLDARSAAISSELAAKLYKLSILKLNIQDKSDNTTRFVVLSRKSAAKAKKSKTSIVFAVRDEPGSLVRMLQIFSSRKINLSKIESRPSKEKQWEYLFYIDFIGHASDKKCKEALAEVKKQAKSLRVLGSYPAA